MSITMYAKVFLTVHFASHVFSHVFLAISRSDKYNMNFKLLLKIFIAKQFFPIVLCFGDQTNRFILILANVSGVGHPAAVQLFCFGIKPQHCLNRNFNHSILLETTDVDALHFVLFFC